jgi:hypothetical protein
MANWTGIWEEAEDKIAQIIGDVAEGTAHVDELPAILPEKETCMYVVDFHGGGTAIEPDSENYSINGATVGSAVEKQVQATITAVATTKRIARTFAESIWNGLPQEPSARPIARIWISAEPNMRRGVWDSEKDEGNERRVYTVEATVEILLTKSATW